MALLEPVQKKAGEDAAAVHEAAAAGIASGGGAMPYASQIQKSFGAHDVSGVQAHTGQAAAAANKAMGAEAFASGNHVAFGKAPDLHTAAHEAAHVVQQQHGVSLSGGVGKSGDAYEQHADKVADAVVRGQSAEGLLSQMTGGAPVQRKATRSIQRLAVQRDDPTPPAHPHQADIDADRAALTPVTKIEDYAPKIDGLKIAPTPASKASVKLRIGKLVQAIPAAEAALTRYYGADAPARIKKYITDRKAMIDGNLAGWATGARAALDKIQGKNALDPADQWDATGPMILFPAMGIEEETTLEVLETVCKGVIKVFDSAVVWKAMQPEFQAGWTTHGGGQAGWLEACKAAGKLVFAPAGKETLPPFAGKGPADAFTGTVRGFVGMGTDASVPTSYAHAISHFALNEDWYKSKVMFLGHCTIDYLKSLTGAIPIGKPSIFKLLQFDENTYEPNDRTFGHLADPRDPTKPGPARELQTDGLPQSEFLSGGSVLS
jgi:hypothetical protein